MSLCHARHSGFHTLSREFFTLSRMTRLQFSSLIQEEMELREKKQCTQGQICSSCSPQPLLWSGMPAAHHCQLSAPGSSPSLLWSLKYPRFCPKYLLLEANDSIQGLKETLPLRRWRWKENVIPSNKLRALLEHVTLKKNQSVDPFSTTLSHHFPPQLFVKPN